MTDARDEWIPVPDDVALLLGRVMFYAAWLDDRIGEAVVLANPDATHLAESTPDWAQSGSRLVSAVRAITGFEQVTDQLADRLTALTVTRNLLVHGVWLWKDESVMVMKRSLAGGERHVDYATFTYAEIRDLIVHYQTLGKLVDRFIEILRRNANLTYEDHHRCPRDGTPFGATVVDDVILQKCPQCGLTASSEPPL